MSATHTPGPWEVEATDTRGESIYICPVGSGAAIARLLNRGDQDLADAQLIAAAPELLVALLALTAAYEHAPDSEVWALARAAIDKAVQS